MRSGTYCSITATGGPLVSEHSSIIEVGLEVRDAALLNGVDPLIDSLIRSLPEKGTEAQVLEDGLSLPALKQFLCEHHLGTEGPERSRSGRLPGLDQVPFGLLNITSTQC